MASPFSFHCMICFEEFDAHVRYPVVLPCSHTYVCIECANRLDKCMECRTPLFELVPDTCAPAKEGPEQLPGWSTRSLGPRTRAPGQRNPPPKRKPPPMVKRRIPLPKNVVLVSLIEATELATENVHGQDHEPSLQDSPMINPSVIDLEVDEEEKIRTGTSLAISDCGTYAVAAKDGLEIFPNRPEVLVQDSEGDVDALVRYNANNSTVDDDKKTSEDELPRKDDPPGRLSWGDRVQIVSTQQGWAKLARGYGYIRAGGNRLVKVGGSVDRSCKLEAMIRLMSSRRKELREEQKKVDNQFIALMNELQVSLMSDEDLTVIAADTFHKNIENNDPSDGGSTSTVKARTREFTDVVPLDTRPPEQQQQQQPQQAQASAPQRPAVSETPERANNEDEDSTPLKPRFTERPVTPPGSGSRGSFFCNSSDVLSAVLPTSSSTPTQAPTLPIANRSPAIAREFNSMSLQQRSQLAYHQNYHQHHPQTPRHERRPSYQEDTPTRILTSAHHPSPSALRAGARAWREMHGRQASAGTDIDFRTGMSGHSALFSSRYHHHGPSTPRLFSGYSNHSGLTMRAPRFPFSGTSSAASDEVASIDDQADLSFPPPGN